MKQFMNVMLMNFRKILLPIIILACVTVVVQVGMYNIFLGQDAAYAVYTAWGDEAGNNDVVCTEPVYFMGNEQVNSWNIVGLASLIIAIMLTIFVGKDNEQNIDIIRNLPVKRGVLWLAKLVSVVLPLVFVYCTNYAAMFLNYQIYKAKVIEKFRALFVFYWNNEMVETFLLELLVVIVIALIISVIYSVKYYRIKTSKKGGK